jgi:hypothetical protein
MKIIIGTDTDEHIKQICPETKPESLENPKSGKGGIETTPPRYPAVFGDIFRMFGFTKPNINNKGEKNA